MENVVYYILSELKPIFDALLVLALGVLTYRFLTGRLRRMRDNHKLNPTMENRLRLLLRWILLLSVLMIVLQKTGLFDHAWAVLSGFLAVATVSLVASWSVLSNGVCALVILIYRPFEIGDTIEILDINAQPGIKGKVIDMNLMYTILRDATNEEKTIEKIPNNIVMQKVIRKY